jgi:hypothetical protein
LGRTSIGWIAPACLAHSFDHLVGRYKRGLAHRATESLGGLEIDRQLELGRLQD